MDFDYVVVGAGSAGATLAARLSARANTQVALIEAGPDYSSADTPPAIRSPNPNEVIIADAYADYRWDSLMARRTKAQPARTLWRGRGVGGSSAINGQIAIRGVPEDFDLWAEQGCRGWAYRDILPAFNRLETDERFGAADYHGDAGPIPIYRAPVGRWGAVDQALAEAALDAGYGWHPDHNAPDATGVSPYAINNRGGVRVSTNDAYLEPARGRNNLAVFGGSLVDRVLFDGDRAIGVRVLQSGRWRDILGGEIILSAGAVHSPAVLMRSGVGPADHLAEHGIAVKADLPVGRSFQDHPAIFLPIATEPFATAAPGARHTNCCVRYSSGLEGAGPNDMIIVAMNSFGDSLGRADRAPQPPVGLIGVWVNQCFSRGSVTLASADPTAQPMVEENMLDHPSDLIRLRDGVRRAMDLARHASVQGLGRQLTSLAPDASDAEVDLFLMKTASDAQHASSSCRMGDEADPRTVVDSDCRVLGLGGLRVIDASVMPDVPRANTHLSAVMVAEHMAVKLVGQH
jgi:5-(hydroxymethyl)furfural/furfural oxidase